MRKLFLLILISGSLACAEQKNETTQVQVGFDHENLELVDPWARPSSTGSNTAAYMFIENGLTNADTLINAYSDIADDVQIHESYATDDGIMGMRRIQNVIIESGDYAQLKPGGMHIMFLSLKQNIAIGDTVAFEIEFSGAGRVQVKAPVRTPS